MSSLLTAKEQATAVGEKLMGESGEHIDEQLDARLPEGLAETVKHVFRAKASADIEDIDRGVTEAREQLDANSRSCQGVLKMRATKGDVTYTVSVCTSAAIHNLNAEKPNHMPTHIQAETGR